ASKPIRDGMTKVLQQCSTCSVVETTDTLVGDWASKLTSQALTALQSHPDANVVLPLYSGMATFALPALRQARPGSGMYLAATGSGADSIKQLQAASDFIGLAAEDNVQCGWYAANQAFRGMLGLPPGDPEVPTRWLDRGTVDGKSTQPSAYFGTEYQDVLA